ncbi:alpha/beta fold hydrolase [Streptomyces sp. NPDC050560]|uniref:alpha/beta fold hydrolase n=1 Tax=Streptomyces sp. NPDC050560 TaxID=3365630 RepID=UPI00378CE86A
MTGTPATPTQAEAVTRDGVTLSYTHHPAPAGSPRIAFVHSLALDRSLWSRVTALLEGRAEMVTYDCRGHGRSQRPPGPYTTGQFADDLADLLTHVGWPDATIVGCSMGGCVAQAFAAAHAGRTTGALFVDTTAWYGPTAPADWEQRAAAARAKGLDSLIPFQLTRWFGDAFREREPDLMRHLTEVFTAGDLDSYEATCRMLGTADLRASAPAIPHPVSILVGEDDKATPPAMARALADLVADGPATVVPGTRHLTPLERPTAVTDALAVLLDRVSAHAGGATA